MATQEQAEHPANRFPAGDAIVRQFKSVCAFRVRSIIIKIVDIMDRFFYKSHQIFLYGLNFETYNLIYEMILHILY